MTSGVDDFATSGLGYDRSTKVEFADLKGKCAAKGPLSKELDGIFDGGNADTGGETKKWCEAWKVPAFASYSVIYDKDRRVNTQPSVTQVPKPAPPVLKEGEVASHQTCSVFESRPSWYESCKAAEENWGDEIGAESILMSKGVTQEMKSVHPSPNAVYDSASGGGGNMEGRGLRMGGDGGGLLDAKRTTPMDLQPFVTLPEKMSLWSFTAEPWKLERLRESEKSALVESEDIKCLSLSRADCGIAKACKYIPITGCIPATCKPDDSTCAMRGGTYRVGIAPPLKTASMAGFCARIWIDPMGRQSFADAPVRGLAPSIVKVMQDVAWNDKAAFDREFGRDFQRGEMQTEGVFEVAKDGKYTFCTDSDDGSLYYIDGLEVVNNGGNHGPIVRCGDRYLDAGQHSIHTVYWQAGSGAKFRLYYKGPDTGGADKDVKSVGFLGKCEYEGPSCECGKGWCATIYFQPDGDNQLQNFPNYARLKPQMAKTMDEIMYHPWAAQSIINRPGSFTTTTIVFDGVLHINKMGTYYMCVQSDDGSRMFVDGIWPSTMAATTGLNRSAGTLTSKGATTLFGWNSGILATRRRFK